MRLKSGPPSSTNTMFPSPWAEPDESPPQAKPWPYTSETADAASPAALIHPATAIDTTSWTGSMAGSLILTTSPCSADTTTPISCRKAGPAASTPMSYRNGYRPGGSTKTSAPKSTHASDDSTPNANEQRAGVATTTRRRMNQCLDAPCGPLVLFVPPRDSVADHLGRTAAAQEGIAQRWRKVAGVITVQGHSGRHDLVDAVKDVVAQRDLCRADL